MKEYNSVKVRNGRAKIGDKVIKTNGNGGIPFYGRLTGIINCGGGVFMVVVRDKNGKRHDISPKQLYKGTN